MPLEVLFPDQPETRYVFERDCLSFPARVDGKPLECLVSGELLVHKFGARDFTESELREAFANHKDEIQQLARQHIQNGWIDENNRVFLTTRNTTLTVTFTERLKAWTEGFQAAQQAHLQLLQLIGPRAGEVNIEWDKDDQINPLAMSLQISDPSKSDRAVLHFSVDQAKERPTMRVHLATTWGSFLRARTQHLILRSG